MVQRCAGLPLLCSCIARGGAHQVGSAAFPWRLFAPPLLFSPLCRRKIYGPNLIEVPVKSYARLLVEEVRIHGQSCASRERRVPGCVSPCERSQGLALLAGKRGR